MVWAAGCVVTLPPGPSVNDADVQGNCSGMMTLPPNPFVNDADVQRRCPGAGPDTAGWLQLPRGPPCSTEQRPVAESTDSWVFLSGGSDKLASTVLDALTTNS